MEQKLRQAQKMDAIGDLAGGIAHDFNNLLSIVLSYSELLAEALPREDPVRSDLQEIHDAGKRATDLTRQLLAFSRQQVLQPRALDLNAAIGGIVRMLRRIVGADVEVTVVHGAGLGTVLADPGQVDQVLMNLVVNARDAMPTGGKLTIEAAMVQLDSGYAATHVRPVLLADEERVASALRLDAPHRRGDASDERTRARRAAQLGAPRDEGPVHVGVHR